MAQDFNKVPSGAELWVEEDTGKHYLVYFTPESRVPLTWHIPGPDDLTAFVGKDGDGNRRPISIDRRVNSDQMRQMGAIQAGTTDEIRNTDEDPINQFVDNFQDHANIKPWLRDPEMLALATEALYEGREVTEAERKNTTWWRTHSDAERAWMDKVHGDPTTAAQEKRDKRLQVEQLLVRSGLDNPDQALINTLADNWTTGRWSNTYVQTQAKKLADPAAPGRLDQELQRFAGPPGEREAQTLDQTENARSIMKKWLGPYANMEAVDHWAGKLRNDPDAEQELVQELRGQKKALFPEYGEDATWQDISGPWKSFVNKEWGQQIQDDNPVLHDVIRMNDSSQASDYLREKGLEQGVDRVVDSALSAFASGVGGAL